ncbi:MAG: DUF4815 domain-containing protein, partial [Endozoicomonadaceae bacterium]|nr:DUF4815 domain-containing protein [Endozoicomonadaceae bacterium]
ISVVFNGVISAVKNKLIILNDSSNDVENVPDSAITFNPTNTEVTITGLTSTSNYIVYADVRKLGETPRTKTKSTITDSNVSLTNRMYSLTKSDIIRITEVKYSGTTNTIPINSFRLDNGQRDNTYELGFLVPLRGAGGGRNIDITYEYFAHGASGDYFSALSYASVDYADIPTYIRNRQDGGKEEIRLSDVLDFRKPYNATEPNLPVIGSRIDINAIVYYLPRIDLLSLDSTGNFVITKGEPSLSPSVSPSPVESMDLATIEIEPYTLSVEDNVHITTKDNRRYTMADIGRIDRRVTNNEYYLSLTLLEKETEALTIRGSDNLDRFKHGFIVDNFRGHGIGDVTDEEYRISIDQDNNELRPMHDALQASPIASRAVTDNVKLHDNGVVTLDYVDEVYVENLLSSRDIDINPYKLASYNSPIILVPNSDIWKDQVPRPSLNVNLEGISDAIARVATSAGVVGTQWNQWNTNWFGRSQTSSNTFSNASTNADTSITTRTFRRTLSTQRGSQTRSGLRTTAVAGAVRSSDFVVDVSYIEFIRPRPVVFYASNLKPNQKYHLFFDEVRQTDNVIPSTQLQIQEIANTPSRNINPREYNTVRGVYQEAFDKPDSKVITNTTHTRSNGGQVNITTMNTVINNPNQMTVLVNSSNITLVGNHVLFYGFSRSNNISLQDSNIDWWSNNLFNISASNRSRYSRSFSGSNPFEAINLKIYKMIAKSGNTLTLETLDGSDALPDVDNTDLTAYNGNQSTNTKGRLYRLQASGVLCLESPAYDFSNTNSRYISEQTPIIPNQRNYHLVNVRNGFGIGEVLDVQGSNRITVIDDLTTKMLTSDYNSISVGTYFIPQGQFKTGERKLKLTDNYSNSDDAFDSISYGDYTAVGLRQETAEISTRPINFRQERVTQNRPTSRNFSSTSLVSSVTRGGIPPAPPPPPPGRAPTRTQNNNFDFTPRGDSPGGSGGGPGGHDPLSQTIYISEETGIMVSKLDLYFNSVGTRPIIVEIRTTQNGIPTYLALPESVVTISPNKVNLPVNNSNPVATTITFPSPVFLKGLETYAITIKTDEPGTTLFVSEIGQQDIRTRNPIARQPSTGSLYISQNSREFQIFQNLDLTFKLYKANFYDTYEGSIEVPFATDSRKLDESPFQIIVNGNKRYLKVFSMNHGGMVDSEITFYTDSTVLNDDLYSIIYNSVHKISDFDLDNDYFHIDLGESTGSRLTIDTNQDGIPVNGVDDTWYVYIDQPDIPTERIGSDNIISMTGIPTADLILLKSNDVIFKETSVNYSYTHDNQTGFKTITQGANTPLSQRENLHNFTVRMLLRRNEPTPLVNTDNISPVVDLTEISEILVRNIISNDSNPSKATYITRPLVLANTADSLRVFFDANIPSGTSIRLSYATSDTTSDLGARNAVGDRLIEWTDLNFTNEIINETNEFSERTINRESIPPYSNLQIRIEMFSNNFVQVPRLKNLRLIAYS